jgi:transcription initiation factor IIE alpha subunit
VTDDSPPPFVPTALKDEPVSHALVFLALEDRGELTVAQLQRQTGLGERTIRAALRTLRSAGIVKQRPAATDDPRRQTYAIV